MSINKSPRQDPVFLTLCVHGGSMQKCGFSELKLQFPKLHLYRKDYRLTDAWSFVVKCWGWVQETHGLRKEAAWWSGGATADTSESLVRHQQGEETVAGVGVVVVFFFSYDKNLVENRQSFPLIPRFYLHRIKSAQCVAALWSIVTRRYSTYTFSPWFQQRAGVLHRLISIPFTLSNGRASTGPIINKQKYADAAPTQRLGVLSGSRTHAGLWNREVLYLEGTIGACIRGRGSARTPSVTATCWQGSKEGRRGRALVRVGE